ncbi:hypothetical protein RHSIM_Rhsim04G0101100 [Rhododendron simsii]|uniref:DYW domain-containing protein n=1 Tax=Rhododendron simsii TaxID=118357 RepID=A0A834LTR8_RHOSS|nr:hypothetical protein RHSIM_Rhsim04G0101100 [Rhododendron simsii]
MLGFPAFSFFDFNAPLVRPVLLSSAEIVKLITEFFKHNASSFGEAIKAAAVIRWEGCWEIVRPHVPHHSMASRRFLCNGVAVLVASVAWLFGKTELIDSSLKRDIIKRLAMSSSCSLVQVFSAAAVVLLSLESCSSPTGSPCGQTMGALLPGTGTLQAVEDGKMVHDQARRNGLVSDVYISTALVDFYAKCGCLVEARKVFDIMPERDVVAWNAMVAGSSLHGLYGDTMRLFFLQLAKDGLRLSPVILGTILRACSNMTDLRRGREIHGSIVKSGYLVDLMVGNTLLSMYAKCGIIKDAVRLFGEMESKDLVSHNAIISGCAQNGKAKEALVTFQEMKLSGLEPDSTTLVSFLPACSHLAALQHGACGHCFSIVSGFSMDTSICNALIDMYSKCGKVDTARLVFDRMHTRDIVSWNAMIFGYGIHGLGKKAVLLFHDMEIAGLCPDDVTFICLLSACSHSGLVYEGKKWFFAMSQYFYIAPRMEHYVCMVDLLGRAGLLYEALGFIEKMPCDPDFCVWSALLAACRTHRNIELGEEVSNKIQNMGHESSGNFVILSNMYSVAGRWDDAAHVRIKQRDQGFKKRPGCSWVEINGVIHAFVGGDRSHPHSAEIYNKLADLLMEMKRLGYQSESSFVFQDVEEEEKESILLYHSEKLAVTFGILTLGSNKPILVTKNLRICGDCHEALKYITIITRREITVRDASRFHHFKDGICNCGDFW